MGKRRLRAGAGDMIALPEPLYRQIEGGKIAKRGKIHSKRNSTPRDSDAESGNELVDVDLSSKILKVAQLQVEEDAEPDTMDGNSVKNRMPSLRTVQFKRLKAGKGEANAQRPIPLNTQGLSDEVINLYKEVGAVLAKFTSGKIPKAFKIIPKLENWEQIIELTCPEEWTAAAMYQATRIFSSSMNPGMCQKFYNLMLLPRIRDDIHEFKRLNPLLYECLFKAMFKPAAFFKGILLPLCDSDDCTLREATIIGKALKRISAPALHACAAMLKIAEMEYSPARAIFLSFLISKNYTLPRRVVDGLFQHFYRMQSVPSKESDPLPVLWHRCLLVFVENYGRAINPEQHAALLELIKTHKHHQISQVIRKQLQGTASRVEKGDEPNHPVVEREIEDDMEF